MAYVAVVWFVIHAALGLPVAAEETATGTAQVEAPRQGGLVLDVEPTSGDSAQRLAVAVQPNGPEPSVAGTADVVGFPIIPSGAWSDADWKVNGSQITGTVKRKDGSVEGQFEGTITATGVSGKFTHTDGRVGLWSWDGPPP